MKKGIFFLALFAVATFTASAQVPQPLTEDLGVATIHNQAVLGVDAVILNDSCGVIMELSSDMGFSNIINQQVKFAPVETVSGTGETRIMFLISGLIPSTSYWARYAYTGSSQFSSPIPVVTTQDFGFGAADLTIVKNGDSVTVAGTATTNGIPVRVSLNNAFIVTFDDSCGCSHCIFSNYVLSNTPETISFSETIMTPTNSISVGHIMIIKDDGSGEGRAVKLVLLEKNSVTTDIEKISATRKTRRIPPGYTILGQKVKQ